MVRIHGRSDGDWGLNSIKHTEIQSIFTRENCWILNWSGYEVVILLLDMLHTTP